MEGGGSMLARIYADIRWFLGQIGEQFVENGLLNSAAALTYTTLFAVVPLMTVGYVILSVLPAFSGVSEQIQNFVFDNFVPESSALIQDTLNDFASQARGLTLAGVAFLIITAFLMLVTMEQAFNRIWQVTQPRRGLPRFLVYWGVLTCGPPLLAAGLLISSYLISLPLVSDIDAFGLRETLLGFVPVLFSVAGFTILYYAMPNCHVPFRHALVGGVLTMLLFEGAKWVFAEVVSNSSMALIYGTFAAVPLFLTWIYLVWALILASAIFVRTLALERGETESDGEPLLVKAARVLNLLYQAHMRGEAVTDAQITKVVNLTREERRVVFGVLEQMNLLSHTDQKEHALGRNLKSVTLWDLYQRLPGGLEPDLIVTTDDLGRLCVPLKDFVDFGADHLSKSLDELFAGPAGDPA
ncbi:MAG: YihY family inner membrane protein [Gammaproteobacteria bacterium]|nr:MAG: YihY family inner membrane protein [Gammaproteobacteria bacterium]TDJ37520.1 MAG: YihY family inner membrane protein [Gammaproteobacteria bacterium]